MNSSTFGASTWLRGTGAAIVVGSGVAYLIEGWGSHDVLWRELGWAGLTVVLSVLGVLTARRLGDAASARIALALAAATIPVHFAELGGAYYAFTRQGLGSWPPIAGAALVLLPLIPVLALGLAALVRTHAWSLSASLFALSAVLLVPTRDPNLVAGLALAELAALLALEWGYWRDPRLQTSEGRIARALLVAPLAILLVRNANYPTSDLWWSAVVGVPSLILFLLPRLTETRGRLGAAFELLGTAGVAAALLIALPQRLVSGLALSAALALGALGQDKRAAWFLPVGQGLAAACALTGFWSVDVLFAWSVLPVALFHAALAYRHRRPAWLASAPAIGLIGLMGQVLGQIHWSGSNVWIVAAVLGVGLLAAASLLDRRRSFFARLWLKCGGRAAEEV